MTTDVLDTMLEAPAAPHTVRQSDCCIARATYRVILPATDQRTAAAELLLCGHHFRASSEALAERGAQVFDSHDRPVDLSFVSVRP